MASNLAATKADLLSRGLIIQTDTIPKGNERRVKAIWDEFEKMKSQLLGYILDVLVKVLKWKKENPGVELVKEYPRLADWAEYCEIVALCIEEKEGAFMEAYNKNLEIQTQEVIEGSDLAIVLRIFIDLNKKFDGSATQLLERLHATAVTNGIDTRNRYWPKTSIRLSHALHILQKTLRDIGIDVSWERRYEEKCQNNKDTKSYVRYVRYVRRGAIKHEGKPGFGRVGRVGRINYRKYWERLIRRTLPASRCIQVEAVNIRVFYNA